jgi:hypothetical protein
MPGDAFDAALAGIFDQSDKALTERLVKARDRAEALQAQDTSRLAFTLAETIEHAIKPAVDEAVESYRVALSRPVTSNPRWEASVQAYIGEAVDVGVRKALAIDELPHPWKPLLKDEASKLRERLFARAEDQFTEIRKGRRRRGRAANGVPEAIVRLALFATGVAVGGLLGRVLGG